MNKYEKKNSKIADHCCRYAWFVTPHGFGHAARASAVMAAVHKQQPTARFDIFTTVPEFIFIESLDPDLFTYHPLLTDVGWVQQSALEVDAEATIHKLRSFIPFDPNMVRAAGEKLKRLGCRAVVCDISPLGIEVAKAAGLPSILIENFTWDWIYFDLLDQVTGENPSGQVLREIRYYISCFSDIFSSVNVHIRTEPAHVWGDPFISVAPISRTPRLSKDEVRNMFGIPGSVYMVLVSNGGYSVENPFISSMKRFKYIHFVMPGSLKFNKSWNVVQLPHNSGYYHPDLLNASDAVIGKPGYSTVAEVYHAKVPFGYISRPQSREPTMLEAFIEAAMEGMPIPREEYFHGHWLHKVPRLIAMRENFHRKPNGAIAAANVIINAVAS